MLWKFSVSGERWKDYPWNKTNLAVRHYRIERMSDSLWIIDSNYRKSFSCSHSLRALPITTVDL